MRYEPNYFFKSAFESGQKTTTIIPAMPEKTDMLLRTLLKIGLEIFAADSSTKDEIFSEKFDAARKYALTGEKNHPWFYIQHEDVDKINSYLKGITYTEWNSSFFADVHEEGELIYLHLKLLYLDFITPLVDNVEPDKGMIEKLKEPRDRLIFV